MAVKDPCGSASKESACNVGDLGSIPGLGRSPGEGKGYPPQYSGLQNSMDCIVHGIAKSPTRLGDFHSLPYLPVSSALSLPILAMPNALSCNLTKAPKATLLLANPPRQLELEGPLQARTSGFASSWLEVLQDAVPKQLPIWIK